jgi:uncharacterized protein HemX
MTQSNSKRNTTSNTKTNTRTNTKTDTKPNSTSKPSGSFAPLYAVAGLTDLIAAEVGQRVAKLQPSELQALARKNADQLLAQYSALVGRGRTRVDGVRQQAEGLKGEAQGRVRNAYGSFVSATKSGPQTK